MDQKSILNINVQDEPVGLIYSPTSTTIEEFLNKFFREKGLQGYIGARCFIVRSNPINKVRVIVYFSGDSGEFTRQKTTAGKDIAPMLEGKIDDGTGGNAAFSKPLFQALRPLVSGEKIKSQYVKEGKKGGYHLFELDIFAILAMMYNCRKEVYEITLFSVEEFDRDKGALKINFLKAFRARSDYNNSADLLTRLYRSAR